MGILEHIKCHIQISSRCGQTSTEVEVDHQVATIPHFRLTWAWSRGRVAGGKVTPGRDLTWVPTGWEVLRGQGCLRRRVHGLSEVPGHEESDEVLDDRD